MGGGCYCPKCQERVYLSSPYSRGVAIVSLLIALGGLTLAGVRTVVGFLAGTVLIWVPLSLFLNAATMNLKPPILRKWKPRRRTFLNGSTRGTQLRNCSISAARSFAELFLRGGSEATSQNYQADKPGDCPHESVGHIYRKYCSGGQRDGTDQNQREGTRNRPKYYPICPEGRPIRD